MYCTHLHGQGCFAIGALSNAYGLPCQSNFRSTNDTDDNYDNAIPCSTSCSLCNMRMLHGMPRPPRSPQRLQVCPISVGHDTIRGRHMHTRQQPKDYAARALLYGITPSKFPTDPLGVLQLSLCHHVILRTAGVCKQPEALIVITCVHVWPSCSFLHLHKYLKSAADEVNILHDNYARYFARLVNL